MYTSMHEQKADKGCRYVFSALLGHAGISNINNMENWSKNQNQDNAAK